jgi:surface antigen
LRAITAVAVLGGLATGGCSYQLQSVLSKDDPDLDQTGSIGRPVGEPARTADAAPPSEVDLAYARAAAADVMGHSGKDMSVPWQNPNSGAGGNITPLASSYNEGGQPCRDFLVSYAHDASQDWLQGAACRTAQGRWEVKSLKPLKRS